MRVGVEILDSASSVALVERIGPGAAVTLTLLDEVDASELLPGTEATLFVVRPTGLYRWPVLVSDRREDKVDFDLVQQMQHIQRRADPRVDADVVAEVRVLGSAGTSDPEEARIRDLSKGGLRLAGLNRAEPGDRIEVAVDLGSGRVAVTGRVVMAYADPAGGRVAHVAFSGELAGALSVIDAYVTRRMASTSQ